MTKQELKINAQKELIKNLKAQLTDLGETFPDQWDKQRGYITTSDCAGPCNESVTTGLDYVVLTKDEMVYRLSGDYQEDSPWKIVNPEEFLADVMIEAEEILSSMEISYDLRQMFLEN